MIPTAGTLTHDKVTFSHRAADILSPSVNIVCIPRVTAVESRLHRPPMPHVALERFVATSPGLRLRAPVVPVWDPEPTVSGLLNPENIPDPEARRFLVEDICSTVSSLFGEELGDRCAIRIHTLQPQTAIRTHTLQPQNPAPPAKDLILPGYDSINVKLEVVPWTKCPRWHADSVGLRLLCTYVGRGTWWIENR